MSDDLIYQPKEIPTDGETVRIPILPPEPHERPDWDDYFLDIARSVSRRADCSRRRVGAVLVRPDRRIASTGYNGSPPGLRGCLDNPCPRVRTALQGGVVCPGYSDCRSVHAEGNALLYASKDDCEGATLYITDPPCQSCLKLIRGAGVKLVVYPGPRPGYPTYMGL